MSRAAWRALCAHGNVHRGTPVRYWLESEPAEILHVSATSSAATADTIYDELAARLAEDAYRPRALYERFRIAVLATTDDLGDDLSAHAVLAADSTWDGCVIRRALEERRRFFATQGATSADHSHEDVRTDPLEPSKAARIYRAALAGDATRAEAVAFRRHMLLEMARCPATTGS